MGISYNVKVTSHSTSFITFKEAIELGKYEPHFLSQFPEWEDFDAQIQYQYVIQAIQNRRRQLRQQWATLANQLNFSEKPHLKEAQHKVEKAMKDLSADEERLIVLYAGS